MPRFLLLVSVLLVTCSMPAQAFLCASPGQDGSRKLGGVINTYWAAPAKRDLHAGQKRLPLGQKRGTGQLHPGDLLLVMQVQGATINASNSAKYGAGGTSGTGWTALSAGVFEWVRVQRVTDNAVMISGDGPGNGLQHDYAYRQPHKAGDQGQARWQLVRVPQYTNLTLTGDLTALPWNGRTGGVLALDVRGTLHLAGHQLDVAGLGFRGGAALPLHGALGAKDDYRYAAPTADNVTTGYGQHGSKGEGVAGTPRWVWYRGQRLNTLPAKGRHSSDGYPHGSMAKGAPGNAGGGGQSLSLDNSVFSAGGGGGGGLPGATGTSAEQQHKGGLGGAGVPAQSLPMRLVLGGGGGASALGGWPAQQGAGGAGGGIILLTAGHIKGQGTFNVDGFAGQDGPAGGGGGGAGSILLWSPLTTSPDFRLTLQGGKGGTGPQGTGGQGGKGRLLIVGALDAEAAQTAHFDTAQWPGVMPGFLCQPEGVVVTGNLFNDKGTNANTAYDGKRQFRETGMAAWPYRVMVNGQLVAQGKSDAQGRFSVSLPASVADKPVTVTVQPAAGWQVVSASRGGVTQVAYQETDKGTSQWRFTPPSGGYYQQLELGVVHKPGWQAPPKRTITAYSTQIFPFEYHSHAFAKVRFHARVQLNGQARSTLLFVDPYCDEHSNFTVGGVSRWYQVTPGQAFCVRLQVKAGTDTEAGDKLQWSLLAETQLAPHLPLIKQQREQQFILQKP